MSYQFPPQPVTTKLTVDVLPKDVIESLKLLINQTDVHNVDRIWSRSDIDVLVKSAQKIHALYAKVDEQAADANRGIPDTYKFPVNE